MKNILTVTIFALLTLASGLFISDFGPARDLDNLISDALIRYFSPETQISDDIVIVFLDEATMKELPYRSPVPRDFLYQLNEKILAAGPKAVGYDIFFKDPTIPAMDARLAASFKQGPVFAVSAGKIGENGKWFEDEPMELFKESLKGVGLSDLPFSSSDATVRFAQFEFDINGRPRPSLVSVLYNAVKGGNAEALLHDPKKELSLFGFKFPPYKVLEPGNETGTRIRFTGPPSKIGGDNGFKIFPTNLVAKGLIPADWLKDKIVLVGAAYEDGTDAFLTPYYSSRYNYERMPGVEIHANVLNSLLTKRFYYELPKGFFIAGLLFTGFLASFLFLFGPVWRGVAAFIGLSAILIFKIVLNFSHFGLVMPFTPFEGSMMITFAASLGYRSVTEGRQKRFVKNVFAKYVPPSVVDKMIANPKLLTLGGEQREITCIFTDIASFTTISEKLDPKMLVSFLNEYLDKLTRIIFKYGGTLDKYEGDAIIAFFGAPLALTNHREAGVLAALEMQKASNEISDKWKDICGREIVTRIGIHSGTAVVGNMGSDLRFDYTAIGDTMNLASRLEGANKFFNTRILASESVIAIVAKQSPENNLASEIVSPSSMAHNDVLFRPLARVKVKGKTEAIGVYEVAGLKNEMKKDEVNKIKVASFPKEVVELTSK